MATLNLDAASSCGVSIASAAKLTVHQNSPSWAGAGNSTSVQYNAPVPGHGTSPRLPSPITAPVVSLITIFRPSSAQPPEDFAPTLMVNRSPMTTGEGTAQTAR